MDEPSAPRVGDRLARVLVVDDEENITFLLDSALRHFGFEVRVASTGRQGLAGVEEFDPDVVLLDVMLPDLDGFDVVKRLRADGHQVPVLFLTARDTVDDKVRGLTLGGDDYVTKPFSLEEVVARVQVILRRQGAVSGSSKLTLADLEMDDEAHVVRRAGRVVELSPTEYNLLRFLLLNAGKVLSRSQILDHVWQYDFGGHATVVETYISYLRKKVDSLGPPLIQTVRGVGYSLRVA
ncbi:MAG TPA: response regulator transcription factor [Acidimicrobiales bacterium]|nr:response regulator transcription factor [Acidimicrobiales bacterium]